MTEKLNKEAVIALIADIINNPTWDSNQLNTLSQEDSDVLELCQQLLEIRHFSQLLSQGDLSYTSNSQGITVGALKQFQANLRHLIWQMNQLAQGDFSQTVSYMGEFSVAFNTVRDILSAKFSTMNALFQRYKLSSETDTLTGLPNRRAFFQDARALIRATVPQKQPVSLIIADIDNFKDVNDMYGHNTGDEVLKQLATLLRNHLRSDDLCCRWGGEEFIFLLCGAPMHVAQMRANQLQAVCENTIFQTPAKQLHITLSLGVSFFIPQSTEDEVIEADLTNLVGQADKCLYIAKNKGRNQLYPPLKKHF